MNANLCQLPKKKKLKTKEEITTKNKNTNISF